MTRRRASSRRYSDRTLKLLWGRAAGRCSIPECRTELFADDSDHDPVVIIGDIAHVEASSDVGPRGNRRRGIRRRDEYDNLILLCKNCHTRIDGHKNKFTVRAIHAIKAEHEAWVRTSLPERGLSRTAWTVILLQGGHPIDPQQAISALRPDSPANGPQVIEVCSGREIWQQMHDRVASSVQAILDRSDPFSRRFSIFPLASVSASVALGFYVTDRPRVRLFQYHRHTQSWDWGASRRGSCEARVVGLPSKVNRKRGELLICFELSSRIEKAHLRGVGRDVIGTIRFQLPDPSTAWLRAESQLDALGQKTHEMLRSALRQFPNARCWHLLAATPAPAAVKIGQGMNPSMTPPVQLYEFMRSARPPYVPSIRLGGGRR